MKNVIIAGLIATTLLATEKYKDVVKCPAQTIIKGKSCGKIDYSEPIFNGIKKFNTYTKKMEECVYLYDSMSKKTHFEIYECEENDVIQYHSNDDSIASELDVDAITNHAEY